MRKTLKNIWQNSKLRHDSLITALAFSFIRSTFGITEILAIIVALNVILGNISSNKGMLIVGILTIVCVIGNFICSYFEQINVMKTGFLMSADKRLEIAKKLRLLPLGFFDSSSRAKVAATLTTTIGGMETASVMVFTGIISGLFNSLAFLIFMLVYDYRIGLVMLLGMVIYLLVVAYQMHISRKNASRLQAAQNELTNSTIAFLRGIKVTKLNSYNKGDESLKKAIKNSRIENLRLTNSSMPSQYLASFSINLFEAILIFMPLALYFFTKDIDITKTIVLLIFSFMAFGSLNTAGSMLSMIGLLDSALNEVNTITSEAELEIVKPQSEPANNTIEFKDVYFSYGKKEILKDINLTIKENSMTAIVGPSGSGKTTLCHLIPRFRDINSGSILIGGANIKNMEYSSLAKRISMVFQNVYLFEDTILNNIRFAKPEASLEEVKAAAIKARCDEFIMKLPNGYDTVLTEEGSSLSGGERERISIARAILKDAPIIILDEATASIDPENEVEVNKAIKELTKNKTVLVIAHKLNTIKNADNIIVLDAGKIVEEGKHCELIKNNGLYNKFVEIRANASKFSL